MRLAWIFLAVLVAVAVADWDGSPSPTTEAADTTTTVAADGPIESTTGEAVATDKTEAPPVTEGPEETEDPSVTGQTPKTTPKAADTTTAVKTTKAPQTTTTKEPEPDVENFSVKCDKTTAVCTYSMQIPGLDIDTFNDLMKETNDTGIEVQDFEDNDLVDLQAGVTKVFDDADATADYVQAQLDAIKIEIADLETQKDALDEAVNTLNTAVYNANLNMQKILNKKSSCLYRMCILREQTTTKPPTTTTTRTTPTPFCLRDENKNICNGGDCVPWYDSYFCTCSGNLDGQENDCTTSRCDIVKDAQGPGVVYSPGYLKNGTNAADDDGCDGAQWVIKGALNYLKLGEKSFTDGDFISKVSTDSSLQLTVLKYKLKITSKTKYAQINQILGYGSQATISYSGPAKDYFHFTIEETDVQNPDSV